jgi:hypothetical protein
MIAYQVAAGEHDLHAPRPFRPSDEEGLGPRRRRRRGGDEQQGGKRQRAIGQNIILSGE